MMSTSPTEPSAQGSKVKSKSQTNLQPQEETFQNELTTSKSEAQMQMRDESQKGKDACCHFIDDTNRNLLEFATSSAMLDYLFERDNLCNKSEEELQKEREANCGGLGSYAGKALHAVVSAASVAIDFLFDTEGCNNKASFSKENKSATSSTNTNICDSLSPVSKSCVTFQEQAPSNVPSRAYMARPNFQTVRVVHNSLGNNCNEPTSLNECMERLNTISELCKMLPDRNCDTESDSLPNEGSLSTSEFSDPEGIYMYPDSRMEASNSRPIFGQNISEPEIPMNSPSSGDLLNSKRSSATLASMNKPTGRSMLPAISSQMHHLRSYPNRFSSPPQSQQFEADNNSGNMGSRVPSSSSPMMHLSGFSSPSNAESSANLSSVKPEQAEADPTHHLSSFPNVFTSPTPSAISNTQQAFDSSSNSSPQDNPQQFNEAKISPKTSKLSSNSTNSSENRIITPRNPSQTNRFSDGSTSPSQNYQLADNSPISPTQGLDDNSTNPPKTNKVPDKYTNPPQTKRFSDTSTSPSQNYQHPDDSPTSSPQMLADPSSSPSQTNKIDNYTSPPQTKRLSDTSTSPSQNYQLPDDSPISPQGLDDNSTNSQTNKLGDPSNSPSQTNKIDNYTSSSQTNRLSDTSTSPSTQTNNKLADNFTSPFQNDQIPYDSPISPSQGVADNSTSPSETKRFSDTSTSPSQNYQHPDDSPTSSPQMLADPSSSPSQTNKIDNYTSPLQTKRLSDTFTSPSQNYQLPDDSPISPQGLDDNSTNSQTNKLGDPSKIPSQTNKIDNYTSSPQTNRLSDTSTNPSTQANKFADNSTSSSSENVADSSTSPFQAASEKTNRAASQSGTGIQKEMTTSSSSPTQIVEPKSSEKVAKKSSNPTQSIPEKISEGETPQSNQDDNPTHEVGTSYDLKTNQPTSSTENCDDAHKMSSTTVIQGLLKPYNQKNVPVLEEPPGHPLTGNLDTGLLPALIDSSTPSASSEPNSSTEEVSSELNNPSLPRTGGGSDGKAASPSDFSVQEVVISYMEEEIPYKEYWAKKLSTVNNPKPKSESDLKCVLTEMQNGETIDAILEINGQTINLPKEMNTEDFLKNELNKMFKNATDMRNSMKSLNKMSEQDEPEGIADINIQKLRTNETTTFKFQEEDNSGAEQGSGSNTLKNFECRLSDVETMDGQPSMKLLEMNGKVIDSTNNPMLLSHYKQLADIETVLENVAEDFKDLTKDSSNPKEKKEVVTKYRNVWEEWH